MVRRDRRSYIRWQPMTFERRLAAHGAQSDVPTAAHATPGKHTRSDDLLAPVEPVAGREPGSRDAASTQRPQGPQPPGDSKAGSIQRLFGRSRAPAASTALPVRLRHRVDRPARCQSRCAMGDNDLWNKHWGGVVMTEAATT